MPKSRIPSPARSQGGIITPRRHKPRGSRSVCSPALSTASGRLTSVIDQFKEKNFDSFVLSPVNTRRSVLTDDTDIEEPRRKSWWKNLNENSRDVMELLEEDKATEPSNGIEDIVDIEVLSQEKKNYTLDLPESSDNESINSIVLPQRRLFTQKENQPQKKFGQLVGTRETLAKLHKSSNNTQGDKTIAAGTRDLFQGTKRSKPIFPAALLNISPNKTAADKTKENVAIEPKVPVRNIFGNRPATKRKNMFADFIVSESEDDISEIQPKVFGFQKKVEQRRVSSISKGREHSPTSSIITDVDLDDDWKHLPSSTMVDNQLDEMEAGHTPVKRARLSRLPEDKEAVAETAMNRSSSSKSQASAKDTTQSTDKTVNKTKQANKSATSKTRTSPRNKDTTTVEEPGKANKSVILAEDKQKPVSQEEDDDENNFVLEYENDDIEDAHSDKNAHTAQHSRKDITTKEKDKSKIGNEGNVDKTLNKSLVNRSLRSNTINKSQDENDKSLNRSKANKSVKTNKSVANTSQMNTSVNDSKKSSDKSLNKSKKGNKSMNKSNKSLNKSNASLNNSKADNSLQRNTRSSKVTKAIEESQDTEQQSAEDNIDGVIGNEQPKTNDDIDTETQGMEVEAQEEQSLSNVTAEQSSEGEEIQANESQKEDTVDDEDLNISADQNISQEEQISNENQEDEKENEDSQVNEAEKSEEQEELKESNKSKEKDSVADKSQKDNGANDTAEEIQCHEDKIDEVKGNKSHAIKSNESQEIVSNKVGLQRESKANENKKHIETDLNMKNDKLSQEVDDNDKVNEGQVVEDAVNQSRGDESQEVENDEEANQSQENEDEDEVDQSQEVEDNQVDQNQEVEDDEVDQSQEAENDEVASESQEVEGDDAADQSQEVKDDDEVDQSQEVEDDDELDQSQDVKDDDEVDQSLEVDDKAEANQSEENEDEDEVDQSQEVEESDVEDEDDNENVIQENEETNNASQEQESEVDQNEEIENDEDEESQEVENDNQSDEEQEIEDSADTDRAIATDDITEDDQEEMEIDDDQIEESNEVETDNVEEEIEESPNVTHDTTGRNRKKVKSPEVILHDKTNQELSFIAKGRNTSVRKTKSMYKDLNLRPSLAPARDSLGLSDGTKDSSAEGSGWDSHRTTRKTLRQTFGRDFTPRKSLRALVMEKSAKQSQHVETLHSETVKFPQANSTEYTDDSNRADDVMMESDHELSRRTRQTTLETYLQKIKQQNIEKKMKMEEAIRNSLKAPSSRDTLSLFKVPTRPPPRKLKPTSNKPKKQIKSILFEELPAEVIEDMKYKPPKRFQPANASWITKRLYKFLENKLEPKYDYKARVRAEKLVETLYQFAKELRRHAACPAGAVDALKLELARLDVVRTHFDFYEFFHEFMPREVRVKVIPDIVNKIPLPRHGVFADILRGNTVQG